MNLVLWFCFALFAIVVVFIFTIVQNALIDGYYRRRTIEKLKTAGEEILEVLTPSASGEEALKITFSVFRRYGVGGYLIYPDGQSVFPDLTDQPSYPALAEVLKSEFTEEKDSVILSHDNALMYVIETSSDGRVCYLCMMSSLESLNDLEYDMGRISIIMEVIVIILSFLASGLVAMIVTKPVSEVTARAKQLARGDYALDFKENYFCREINELSETLDYACVEISKTEKMQEELIANVSHDFKTPLTMIKAYASMIREISGNDKAKRDANAKVIVDESDRLTALVDDLLDLSKIKAGFGADEKTTFNLSEEVYCVTKRFDFLKETAGYTILTEIEDDAYVLASRARIDQVLYNLIGNAVNYTGEDKTVIVRLFSKGQSFRFEVADSGRGIGKEEISTIWDRYYRSSETHKRPVKGTGLGLSIVKGILQAHGYPFGVESEENKGSVFWVEFVSAPTQEEPENRGGGAPKQKKERVRRLRGET